ncbi:outer membrane protein assembly factor BamC [Shewanella intestini]|uniref:Outer membrane protein assembly factor BamC n=1 Tax=Shewanella intestini TaxID=2017544 RepID=A0ABS5I0M6_9GAMM|nr:MULTISPECIES: outer membrane protein assembly factor BamC [Shewanella]MBR9727244.1 outer membrane protein assembly factor BamC [Shewanella intestini]MRG36046.1 outer membrane protein assembly factor BamC [Shewanella sp. XMDDZSB0408]
MIKKATPVLLLLAVTACSTPIERRQVNGNDDYTNVQVSPLLTIPAGLSEPNYSKEYDIPKVAAQVANSPVGKQLDIRPPLQVLPMAEGTHVEEGSDNIKVVIESIDNDVNLKQEIFADVIGYLNKNNINIRNQDTTTGVIETDWIKSTEVMDSSLWGADKEYILRQRYKFTVDVKPHGRSGDLKIDLVEHEESFDEEIQDILLTSDDKRRYTIDMLNNAIAYVSVNREKALREARIKRSLGIKLSLVRPTEEQGAYWLADAKYDNTWDRLRVVLPELGFEIVDMDKSKGLYYVTLDDSGGFWSSIWGDKDLNLEKGNYRIMIEEGNEPDNTKILFKHVDDEPIADEAIIEVYDKISELMEEDRKVR